MVVVWEGGEGGARRGWLGYGGALLFCSCLSKIVGFDLLFYWLLLVLLLLENLGPKIE